MEEAYFEQHFLAGWSQELNVQGLNWIEKNLKALNVVGK